MTKNRITPYLLFSMAVVFAASEVSAAGESEWRIYSEQSNGDVHFFDASRVKTTSDLHTVWTRIRYKRSVMGASSYQSLLDVDCSERTERILQSTFFSDKHWEKPAMNTDMKAKRKRPIIAGSAVDRLAEILCNP